MQRRYTETAGALAVSVAFVLVALFFVYQPRATIGQASQWTNQLSLAFLSGAHAGLARRPQKAKRDVADQLFEHARLPAVGRARVRRPRRIAWTRAGRQRRVPHARRPARSGARTSAAITSRRARTGTAATRRGSCVRRPALTSATPSTRRCKKGELPVVRNRVKQFAGYKVDKADTPAVDIQQAGGAYQRLTVAAVVFAGALGRRRAARVPLAGGDPRPGRRAGAAWLRADRAGDRDLPRRRARRLQGVAGQARDRGVHQGALLAGDRDRRRGRRRR